MVQFCFHGVPSGCSPETTLRATLRGVHRGACAEVQAGRVGGRSTFCRGRAGETLLGPLQSRPEEVGMTSACGVRAPQVTPLLPEVRRPGPEESQELVQGHRALSQEQQRLRGGLVRRPRTGRPQTEHALWSPGPEVWIHSRPPVGLSPSSEQPDRPDRLLGSPVFFSPSANTRKPHPSLKSNSQEVDSKLQAQCSTGARWLAAQDSAPDSRHRLG